MAKPLRDIASKAPKGGKLSGVKKSTTEPADISDFNASSGNQDFAKKHEIEKHEDRVGNGDDVYKGKTKKAEMKRHGYEKPKDEKIYEAKCNMTEAGVMCEVHGDKDCSSDKVPEAGVGKRGMIADKKKLQEVLTKKTPAGKVISDFVHSDDSRFSGDSKKQRIKRALGAYYGMHPEKSVKEETEQLDEMPSQHRSAAGSGKNTNPNLSRLARKLSMEKPRSYRPKGKMSKAEERAEAEKLSADKEVKKYPPGKARGVKEEAEQIDEISKDLAGDYIKSASSSAANLKTDAAYANMTNDDARADKLVKKARNRQAGIYTAVNKITDRAKVPANEDTDPYVKNLPPISSDNSASPERLNKLASMAGSTPGKVSGTSQMDKEKATSFESGGKKKIKEELAMPMLEGGKKKKPQKESAPGDTPIRFPSGDVGDTGRV